MSDREEAAANAALARRVIAAGLLRPIREKALLTGRELATLVGTSPHSVSLWEAQRTQPRLQTAIQLGEVLRGVASTVDVRLADGESPSDP